MTRFWEIRAQADGSDTAEMLLYGMIGGDHGLSWLFDEVTPRQFDDDLKALGDINALRLRINSEGGDVFAAQAIHNMLVHHKARVTTYIDGLAASSASLVAMAGDTIIMPSNALMMVHNPWTAVIGDARDMRKMADTLDQVRESMIATYQGKTGKARTELINLLNSETWMTADEAVAMGFADVFEARQTVAASLVRPGVVSIQGREFDLTMYRNFPGLRDAGPTVGKREAERALRDAGFSRRQATAIVTRGWAALGNAEPPQPEAADNAGEAEDRAAIAAGLQLHSDYLRIITDTRRTM